jgi:Aminomethyltransferase folate-binding domain
MMRATSILRRRIAAPLLTRSFAAEAVAPDGLAKTMLHDRHVELGGKMVPFAGYSMPVQYDSEGIKDSHLWVRANAGLFDISHMGESTSHWAADIAGGACVLGYSVLAQVNA